MKSASKLALLLAALLAPALLFGSDRLFTAVPATDPTYTQLKRLEDLGLVPRGSSAARLTRYEVAQLIFRARRAYEGRYRVGVRLAQADLPPDLGGDFLPPPDLGSDLMLLPPGMEGSPAVPAQIAPAAAAPSATSGGDIPPPPPDGEEGVSSAPAVSAAPSGGVESQAIATAALGSLEEAYQHELKALQADIEKSSARVKELENEQFKLWKRIQAFKNSTAIYLNGLGRAFTETQSLTGDVTGPRHYREQFSFLDLNPHGIVSKEVRWSAIFRVQSRVIPQTSQDDFFIDRATLEFHPAWMDSTFGDFEESYTPLTLWNRRLLDLRYFPEIMDRSDRYALYTDHLERDEHLPFRGARIGTSVMWPKSEILESWSVSSLVHMINSGHVTGAYLPHRYTGWIFGGKSSFRARRYLQLEAYGLMLDEPLDTDDPASAYGRFDTTTWAQRYQVGSLRPTLDYDVTPDVTVGATYEMAYSIYNDDKRDAAKTLEDHAWLGGPFIRYRKSTLRFNFVDNGVAYFSPLAQYRADTSAFTGMVFMTELPRASGIFASYDRTMDNVFPYGLSTPNRKGGGLEADLKALDGEALKMRASFYQLREQSGNFVMDEYFTDFVPVDGLSNSPAAVRDFTYINVGPSVNLAPLLDLKRDLEIGLNFRSEKTESWIGELKSDWILAGLRAGLRDWWQVSVEGANMTSKGRESYLNGTLNARYSYLFDNTDLGNYWILNAETTRTRVQASMRFDINKNSTLHLDGYSETLKVVLPDYEIAILPDYNEGKATSGGGRLVYEIRF